MKPTTALIIALALLSSCISNKEVVMFQDARLNYKTPTEFTNAHSEYKLQSGDVLSIRVRSYNQENAAIFNMESNVGFMAFNDLSNYVLGYSVSDSGSIRLPGIGNVKIIGKTVPEATRIIQARVSEFIKDGTVMVNLVSFKISIFGEVNRPGYYFVYNNRCTILEAISLAGDLREFADRRQVQLLRQTAKGTEAILIDLTSIELLQSPYFFMKPNDVLYVLPLESRNKRSNLAVLNVFNLGIAAVATTVTTINVVNNLRRNP